MREHLHKKNILLLGSCIIILAAVIIFVHKKESKAEQVIVPTQPANVLTVPEIKGSSKTDKDAHMALTSTNIIWFTNYYRAQQGLKPLTLSTQLRDSAYHKSLDMFKYQYFDHYRPGNKLGFDNFIDNQNYDFIKVGENLAKGDFTTSKEIVDAWMKSPAHRKNILDATYTEIGVSVDYGVMRGERSVLITQHFGKPKTTCPVVDANLHMKIKNLSKQLVSLKESIAAAENESALIIQYNTILTEREGLVATYNNQVYAFDACVAQYIF